MNVRNERRMEGVTGQDEMGSAEVTQNYEGRILTPVLGEAENHGSHYADKI